MPPKTVSQLADEAHAARVARAEDIKSEIARLDEGLSILDMEIQQQKEAVVAQQSQRAGAAQGTYQHLNGMPGSYIDSGSSACDKGQDEVAEDDDDSTGTEVPAGDNENMPPTSIAAKYALVARLQADLAAKDYCAAFAHCVEILAHIQEDLALHVVYLDTVANRKGTELAVARLAMADAGLTMGEGASLYCSETEEEGDDSVGTSADDEVDGEDVESNE